MANFVFVYITNPSKEEARRIAKHLLDKKLIACGNIFPISSLYRWEGNIAEENEFVLIAKTSETNFEEVRREVEKIHPYTTPCIVKIPVYSNKKYFDWLKSEIKEGGNLSGLYI
jgi:periplasmic divalent cation tolerance protein